MLAYIRRVSTAAWEFLVLPFVKCLALGGFHFVFWATVASLALVRSSSTPIENAHDVAYAISYNRSVELLLLALIGTLCMLSSPVVYGFLFEKYIKEEDSPSLKKFLGTVTGEITPKASMGAVSLSVENTPGSLSLVDRGALSLHTKDPA